MFVAEPSDPVNAGMAVQTEGRRLVRGADRRPSVRSLVSWLVCHRLSFGFLNPEDGTDGLHRNVGKNLPPLAA